MTAGTATVDTWWLDWFRLATLWTAEPSTRTYRCTRCDVSETVERAEATACWSCGHSDALIDA